MQGPAARALEARLAEVRRGAAERVAELEREVTAQAAHAQAEAVRAQEQVGGKGACIVGMVVQSSHRDGIDHNFIRECQIGKAFGLPLSNVDAAFASHSRDVIITLSRRQE